MNSNCPDLIQDEPITERFQLIVEPKSTHEDVM